MTPFFSIIIPAYNRRSLIGGAVQSVLSQTFNDFEIILVDDGSTDGTGEAISQFKDDRIHYFRKENEERSIARNFGVAQARGIYVGFLDSDDRLQAHHLKNAYDLIQRNASPEIAHLNFEIVDAEGRRTATGKLLTDVAAQMLEENVLCVNTIFIRKDIALQFTFPKSRLAVISEDWCLFMKLVSRFPIHSDNTVSCTVLDHGERSLRNLDPDKVTASIAILVAELTADSMFNKKYGDKVGYFFSNQMIFAALILALTKKRRKEALRYLILAVKYDAGAVFRKRFLAALRHIA